MINYIIEGQNLETRRLNTTTDEQIKIIKR